jgi:hypothetical protein
MIIFALFCLSIFTHSESSILGIQGVSADPYHSMQKMRIHKNFIKEVLDKNFEIILEHCEGLVKKNVFLTEINIRIDDL